MLIKLTKISFTTVGHPARVDRTITEPIWINPAHIISVLINDKLPEGRLPCERLTQVCIGNGSFKVLETPEQINNLIAGYSKGGFA